MEMVKSCGAVVYKKVSDELLFLLVQMNRGHWSFPKGQMEERESEQETAIREIKEETNLDVEFINGFRERISYRTHLQQEKEVIYFLAIAKSNDLQRQIEEIKNITWCNFDIALNQLSYNTDKEILKQAIIKLKQ